MGREGEALHREYIHQVIDSYTTAVERAANGEHLAVMVWKEGMTDNLDLTCAELFDDIPASELAYVMAER
jgi:dissimilatory sulfite reductase (desulfoviridin) alpha/beta subunit